MSAACAVEECERPAINRGWCGLHYQRWRTTGSLVIIPKTRPKLECIIDGCERTQDARGWCSLHYSRWRLWGTTDGHPRPTTVERFISKVGRADGCWTWRARVNKDGYGIFHVGARTVLAHRFAYAELVGPIPDGMYVLHKCDNPPCVRPDHLEVGTQKDNMQQASARGRMAGSERRRQLRLQKIAKD